MQKTLLPPLIEMLLRKESYTHPAEQITLMETHISWVILAGDFAYKIKKPLNLGFLDFSTLEKRRHYCTEELRLNQRLAPQLYLNVVAISQQDQDIVITTESQHAIEYAVQMRRFSQQQMLLPCLQQHQVSSQQIRQFANTMATFHQQIARTQSVDSYDQYREFVAVVDENFHHIQQFSPSPQLDTHHKITLDQIQHHKSLIQQRQRNGFVRECHGDLHLANLVVLEQKIVPFDCIEFNPKLYWIDVISEIAFLIMDLQQRGYDEMANQFLNQYLQQTGDYHGIVLLPIYLNYRAMVRAKISAIRLQQEDDTSARDGEHQQFSRYLRLAQDYSQQRTGALIITHGLSGSGKSWLCQQLSPPLNAIQIRSDVERKRLFNGLPEEQLYSTVKTRDTYHHLRYLAEPLISSGEVVLIDATCLQPWQRTLFQELAEKCQVPFLILQLHVPYTQLEKNILHRQKLKNDPSDADLAILAKQYSTYHAIPNTPSVINHQWQNEISTTLDTIQQKLTKKS